MNSPQKDSKEVTLGRSIPYDRFLDCVHCGLCTTACPTYVETGDENDGPRGRIYLMRAVVDGRLEMTDRVQHHLDLCLDCRSCETACPSGVQYGRLLEPFRVEMRQHEEGSSKTSGWFQKWILFGLFPFRNRMRWALKPASLAQRLKLDRVLKATGLLRLFPRQLQRMQLQLPRLRPVPPALPDFLPASGETRARVGLFLGCVADAMFRHVHWATARVLQENGCDVYIPSEQTCCGAIHYHNGESAGTLSRMKANMKAFPSDLDAIVVNVAGCGSMLKDYGHIHEESGEPHSASDETFVQRVKDVSEFLAELGIRPPTGQLKCNVAYQDACHLQHAQRIHQQPRQALESIPGVTVKPVEEPELCCGAAGSYSLTQPDMADRLGARKAEHLLDTNPDLIVTANAGCSLQLQSQLAQMGSTIPVVHPMELLDLSYRNGKLEELI